MCAGSHSLRSSKKKALFQQQRLTFQSEKMDENEANICRYAMFVVAAGILWYLNAINAETLLAILAGAILPVSHLMTKLDPRTLP